MIGHVPMGEQQDELNRYRDLDHFDILSQVTETVGFVAEENKPLDREKKARNHYIDEMIKRKAQAGTNSTDVQTEKSRRAIFLEMEKLKSSMDRVMKSTDASKVNLARTLKTAIGLCDGVFAYGLKKLPVTDEGFFRSNVVVVQSMMAMAGEMLEGIKDEARMESMTLYSSTVKMAKAMNEGKLRIYEEAEKAFAEKESVDWFTLMQRAGVEETISVDDADTTGGAQSQVYIVDSKLNKQENAQNSQLDQAQENAPSGKQFVKKSEKRQRFAKAVGDELDSIPTREAAVLVTDVLLSKITGMMEQMNEKRGKNELELNTIDVQQFLHDYPGLEYDHNNRFLEMQMTDYLIACYKHYLNCLMTQSLKIKEGERMSNRNIATVKMAQLLGLEHLVVGTTNIKVREGNVVKAGILMEGAQGEDVDHIAIDEEGVHEAYDGEFQRQLIQLQVLDNICGQRDRHLNNIFYKSKVLLQKAKSVRRFSRATGIDNDLAFGETAAIDHNDGAQMGVLRNVEPDKARVFHVGQKFHLPVMDEELYYSIMAVTPEMIRGNLHGLVGEPYIQAAIDRFQKIRTALKDTYEYDKKSNVKFLYKKEEWGDATLLNLAKPKEGQSGHDNYVQSFVSARVYDRNNKEQVRLMRQREESLSRMIRDKREEYQEMMKFRKG